MMMDLFHADYRAAKDKFDRGWFAAMTDRDIQTLEHRDRELAIKAWEAREEARQIGTAAAAPPSRPAPNVKAPTIVADEWTQFVREIDEETSRDPQGVNKKLAPLLDAKGLTVEAGAAAATFPLLEAHVTQTKKIDVLTRQVANFHRRLEAVEQDKRELRAEFEDFKRKHLGWVGYWQPGLYPVGSEVTHRNTVWRAERDTTSKPGTEDPESRAWIIKQKAPRDGDRGRVAHHHDED